MNKIAFLWIQLVTVAVFAALYAATAVADQRHFACSDGKQLFDMQTPYASVARAIYFALTVQSTAGFGDITPQTLIARVLVSLQMVVVISTALVV